MLTQTMHNTELVDRARRVIPGGVNSVNRVLPWPFVATNAHGAYITDADGRQYLDYHAAFHDEANGLHQGRIARRIAIDSDQVGEQAGPNLAAVGEAEDLRIARRRRLQNIRGRHAGSLHRSHLEPV